MSTTAHTERAVKLVNALQRAREHLSIAGAMPEGSGARNELLEVCYALLEALELSNGVVFHGVKRLRPGPPAAPGSQGSPTEAA